MDEVWGRFERAAPPCGFCSRMETASSSVGLLLAILTRQKAPFYTLAFCNFGVVCSAGGCGVAFA